MKTFFRHLGFLVLLILGINSAQVFAGGPLILFAPGVPYFYSTVTFGGPIPVFTDLGAMGPLTNAEADALTTAGFAEWSAVPTSFFDAAVVGDFSGPGGPFVPTVGCELPLPDIVGTNAGLVVGCFNGGGFHILYDDDGTIISDFFGAPPGVLGIASPDFTFGGIPEIAESWAVVNGAAVDPGDVGGASFGGVFTHEFGHAINLAHTQTNGGVFFFLDNSAPDTCPSVGSPTSADMETMYPFIDPSPGAAGVDMATIDKLDDIASISDVYPTGGWPGVAGTITGTIFLSDGVTEITGVNVIARNAADPFGDANSALSGDFTQGGLGPDGLYTLNGLTPGADYEVYVDGIVMGGFSTPPAVLPGPEEYWNGGLESADVATDDPCDVTSIAAVAGAPFTADVIFNGGPSVVILGDDDFEERPLPFAFPFCGTDYSSVFIGSNGFLTFGVGDTDFSESVGELLDSPARIAPLWDDLNPSAGGIVTAEEVAGDFVVTYTDIPEFSATGSNTFAITLRPDGSFNMTYGAVSALDGIVGASPGLGVFTGDPGEIDVTAAAQPISGAPGDAVYENFTSSDNDLTGADLDWAPCGAFSPTFTAAANGVCYGSTGASDGGRLLTIDPMTGAGTLVGSTGIGLGVPGLAINSAGDIYGTERISGDLYRIDAATGVALLVGPTGVTFLDAIAFDENDVLYGIGFDPPLFNLRIIDTTTGASTIVGPTGDIYVGMAFDPTTGLLYASVGGFLPITPDGIARIDKATGAATVLGTTGFGGPTPDLHFGDFGTLYGSKGGGFVTNTLITIDKTTGAGTAVGSITGGFTAVSGLAARPPVPASDFSLEKDADSLTPDYHSNVVFTLTLTNIGPTPGTAEVEDVLPAGLTFVSADPAADYDEVSGIWTTGLVAVGVPRVLTITALVETLVPVTNEAEATGTSLPDPDPSNNSASVTITPVASDLAITKTLLGTTGNAEADSVKATFKIKVTNNGPTDATGVTVEDPLPEGASLESTSDPGSYDPDTGIWTIGTLTAGASVTLFNVVAADSAGNNLINVAMVSGDQPDQDLGNNSTGSRAHHDLPDVGRFTADLELTKTVDDETPSSGGQIVYTLTVTNRGPSTTGGVVVSDTLAAGLEFVSATVTSEAGQCPTCGYNDTQGVWTVGHLVLSATATLEITVQVTGTGEIVNTAEIIEHHLPDRNGDNDIASATITASSAQAKLTGTEDEGGVPETYALHHNYPNPFNPETRIRFGLPEAAYVRLVVYDAMGREVARLVDGSMAAGNHHATWSASGYPSGVYLYRLTTSAFTETKAMTLLK